MGATEAMLAACFTEDTPKCEVCGFDADHDVSVHTYLGAPEDLH